MEILRKLLNVIIALIIGMSTITLVEAETLVDENMDYQLIVNEIPLNTDSINVFVKNDDFEKLFHFGRVELEETTLYLNLVSDSDFEIKMIAYQRHDDFYEVLAGYSGTISTSGIQESQVDLQLVETIELSGSVGPKDPLPGRLYTHTFSVYDPSHSVSDLSNAFIKMRQVTDYNELISVEAIEGYFNERYKESMGMVNMYQFDYYFDVYEPQTLNFFAYVYITFIKDKKTNK